MPEGWAWIRIKDIVNYIGDGDWIESKDQSSDGIRLIQTGNIGFGKFKDKEGKYHYITEKTFDALQCNEIFAGDILISRLPEPVGRACIIPCCAQRMITAVDCTIIRLSSNVILKEYFIYYTQSKQYLELIKQNCTGTTRLRISRANLEKIFVPLPPIKEQKKIMDIINEQFSFIEEIENNKEELQTSIKQAKSKILDLAIHGKLVPQDPSDEPAEEILKRIATSDNRPYEKFDDELPYEIPTSWMWAQLGEICELKSGNTLSKAEELTSGKYIYIKVSDMNLSENSIEIITSKSFASGNYERFLIKKNSIVFPKRGGALLTNKKRLVLKSPILMDLNLMAITPLNSCLLLWIYQWFTSIDLGKINNGSNIPQINNKDIAPLFIPIPPLSEQRRIVSKIEELYSQLDLISSNIE